MLVARRGKNNGPVTATSHRAHLYDGLYDLQVYLLIPIATLATIAGLIGAAIRPRRPAFLPSPTPAP